MFLNIDTLITLFLSNNDSIEQIDKIESILDKVRNKEYLSTIFLNNFEHAIDWGQSGKIARIINISGNK